MKVVAGNVVSENEQDKAVAKEYRELSKAWHDSRQAYDEARRALFAWREQNPVFMHCLSQATDERNRMPLVSTIESAGCVEAMCSEEVENDFD